MYKIIHIFEMEEEDKFTFIDLLWCETFKGVITILIDKTTVAEFRIFAKMSVTFTEQTELAPLDNVINTSGCP